MSQRVWRGGRGAELVNQPPYVGEEHRIILAANAQCHIHTLFILFSILSSLILWDECTLYNTRKDGSIFEDDIK